MGYDQIMNSDTIAAVSTAVGEGGIAIIRISGTNAFSVAGRLFRKGANKQSKSIRTTRDDVNAMSSHTVSYGHLFDAPEGELLDEVMLLKLCAPRTYTREDVVEIHCHGGTTVTGLILNAIFAQGVRPADPGEFTRRAFLNGRLDLTRAEAVMDLIRSRTERGARQALHQLEGQLAVTVNRMREALLQMLGQLEVNLDYPEHDEEDIGMAAAIACIGPVREELSALLRSHRQGRILQEGMNLVIAGRPNAGKSSLMNRLAGQDRSIVTSIPGTTRDVVESVVNLKGLPVRLLDTAGLRDSEDAVEKLGMSRTLAAMERAELILAVFDGADMPNEQDEDLIRRLEQVSIPVIYVMNKSDVAHPDVEAGLNQRLPALPCVVSAVSGSGMEGLTERIVEVASGGRAASDEALLLTNARHHRLLQQADERLDEAERAVAAGMTHDILAFLVRDAWLLLGAVVGEGASEELLDSIFTRFCLGK